jgi:ComEC/Rec2-related protein
MLGMVFGGSTALRSSTKEELAVAGLTHVISASGYNLTVLISFISIFLDKMIGNLAGGRLQALVTAFIAWSYAIMAGLGPPILRAVIMVSLFLLAKYFFYRQYHSGRALLITLMLMIAWNPWFLRSLSFWLSGLASMGIISILPILTSSKGIFYRLTTGEIQLTASGLSPTSGLSPAPGFSHTSGFNPTSGSSPAPGFSPTSGSNPALGFTNPALGLTNFLSRLTNSLPGKILRESFLVTLSAQILTLPLVALVFGRVSWLSFITNSLLLWLTPLITIAGISWMLLGLVFAWWSQAWSVISSFALLALYLFTQVFLSSLAWFGQLKIGLIELELAWWQVGLWWLVVAVVVSKKAGNLSSH